jgi:hypothetical protein
MSKVATFARQSLRNGMRPHANRVERTSFCLSSLRPAFSLCGTACGALHRVPALRPNGGVGTTGAIRARPGEPIPQATLPA